MSITGTYLHISDGKEMMYNQVDEALTDIIFLPSGSIERLTGLKKSEVLEPILLNEDTLKPKYILKPISSLKSGEKFMSREGDIYQFINHDEQGGKAKDLLKDQIVSLGNNFGKVVKVKWGDTPSWETIIKKKQSEK